MLRKGSVKQSQANKGRAKNLVLKPGLDESIPTAGESGKMASDEISDQNPELKRSVNAQAENNYDNPSRYKAPGDQT